MAALVARKVVTSQMRIGSTAEHKAVSECAAIAEDFLQVMMSTRESPLCSVVHHISNPSILLGNKMKMPEQ